MRDSPYKPPVTAAEARAHISAIQLLMQCPGWKLFQTQLEAAKQQEMHSAVMETSHDKTLRSLGAVRALELMLEWPERHAEQLEKQLQEGALHIDS